MNKLFSVCIMLLLIVSPLALADKAGDDAAVKAARGESWAARSARLGCAVELGKAHLDVLAKYSQKDVSAQKSALDKDLSVVKDAAAAMDGKKFNAAASALRADLKGMKSSVEESRKADREAIKAERIAARAAKGSNQSANETVTPKVDREARKADLKAAQDAFRKCESDAMKGVALAEAKVADSVLRKLQAKVDELKSKGADVSDLQKAVDAAKAQKDKIDQAAASGDVKSVQEAMKEWRDLDLHVQANAAILRVRTAIAKAEEKAKEKNVTVDFSAAKSALDKAAGVAAPGHKYEAGEFDSVWSNIKDASKYVKEALKKGNAKLKEAREKAKEAREAAKEAVKDAKDAAKDAREAAKEAVKDAKDAAKDAKDAAKEASDDKKDGSDGGDSDE